MPTITNADMEQRRKIAAAKCSLWDAMGKHSDEKEELTGPEWIAALQAVQDRMIVETLKEQREQE